jgi:hypothetical protein
MSTNQTFGPQLLGQTEKALNAILDRLLADSGVTEPQWVTLSLAAMTGGDGLAPRVASAVKIGEDEARGRIAELTAAGMLAESGDPTSAGRAVYDSVRARTAEITQRLWGDLPAADLEAAARVLGTALGRAGEELARL